MQNRWMTGLGLVFLALNPGCFLSRGTAPSTWRTDAIVIGELSSMTGAESAYGLSTHEGIALAVDQANQRGGIHGKKIEVITRDTQGKTEIAISQATRLITENRVQILLGEVASALSLAIAPVAQSYRVPLISPASTHPKLTSMGDYIFRSCFIEPFQGSVMAKFAIDHLNLKKAAILRDQESEYSHSLANYFLEDFKQMGGRVVLDIAYSPRDKSFKPYLNQIKASKPDIIFIPGYYRQVEQIAREAAELNLRATLLGGDGWEGSLFAPMAKTLPSGAYFSTHFSIDDQNPAVQAFVAQFKDRYGKAPNALSALGYDAARIALKAIEKAPSLSPSDIREALSETRNFEGVTGMISMNKDRNAVKPAVVLRVEPSGGVSYISSINPG
ncbi:ABC transporter substrate-binding protein [bacterium]|nr:ABC transporter substrate-binding protein [bacterium]